MDYFGSNLNYLRLKKGLGQKEIAESLGFSRTQWSNYEKSGSYPKFLDLMKIARYFDISESHLIHTDLSEEEVTNPGMVAEPEIKYRGKLRSDQLLNKQTIPLYNLEATAGLVHLFQDHNQIAPIDFIRIPNLPKCDGAVFVAGDSMYPLLKSGDIVMYKQVHDIENGIFWGQMYLLSVAVGDDEFVMVKYIQKSEKGEDYITLVSENRHHQNRCVKIANIRALAIIKGSIRINTMN